MVLSAAAIRRFKCRQGCKWRQQQQRKRSAKCQGSSRPGQRPVGRWEGGLLQIELAIVGSIDVGCCSTGRVYKCWPVTVKGCRRMLRWLYLGQAQKVARKGRVLKSRDGSRKTGADAGVVFFPFPLTTPRRLHLWATAGWRVAGAQGLA